VRVADDDSRASVDKSSVVRLRDSRALRQGKRRRARVTIQRRAVDSLHRKHVI